jgi:NADPH2:quinone reductase
VKAVLVEAFGPLDAHAVTDAPDPAPTPGKVVIDVHAADTSYADILVIEGTYQVKPPLPFSPGKSAAGIVRSVGEGVTQVAPGDRVLAQVEYGAYAEQVAARKDEVFAIPPTIGFETAAALGLAYQTASFALVHRGRFSAGERVLVLGASGGVGVAAIQLAKSLGAGSVIAAVRAEPDAAVARRAGADTVILIDRPDLREALREEVFAVTAGHGADIVIDPVGGAVTEAALRAVAWQGRLVIVGFAAGQIPTIRANYLLVKNIEVSGLQWSDYREREPGLIRAAQEDIFRLAGNGQIAPIIEVRPLAEFADALQRMKRGEVQGKLVLRTR